MKKNIGILSVYNHNYGSILQAYALQTVLQNYGYNTEILKYKKTNLFKQAKRLLYIPLLKATVKMKFKSIYCLLFQRKVYKDVIKSREKSFCNFISENLKFSSIYVGRESLKRACDKYDIFVLGSDQVWNPMNLGGDFYTMTFIPDNKKKITYAPSFGVSKIPRNQKKITSSYLKRIDYISVRESEGIKIVKELTGRDVPMVVDPTILLGKTEWDKKCGEHLIKEDYIFCYFISSNVGYREFAKKLAQKTKLKIVTIPHVDEFVKADMYYADIIPNKIGPIEFVNLVSNAKYVCTDSFHGTVFATLYEKPFFTFSRYENDSADSTNSRLYSFLKLVHLEDRLYTAECEIDDSDLTDMAFKVAHERIEVLKQQSIRYLENALKN